MAKSVMLDEGEREQLAKLFSERDELVKRLRASVKADDDSGEEFDEGWSDLSYDLMGQLLKANQKLIAWNDRVLSGTTRTVCSEDEGIPGAPLVSLNGAKLDFTDPALVFSWCMEGEGYFLSVDAKWTNPADVIDEEENEDYADYIRALRHAAKTGWPLLTKKQLKIADRVLVQLREAEHFFGDLVEHGKPLKRS
jgi:hypothetical protein